MYRSGDLVHETYRIEAELSEHEGILTYSATAEGAGRFVLTCLYLSRITGWSSVQSFERRVGMLRRIEHRSVPLFIEYFEDESGPEPVYCIVRRYIEGETLEEAAKRNPENRGRIALEVFRQVLDALAVLHAFNPPVIHGNIRPEHILRADDGSVYLLGLGSELPEGDVIEPHERARDDIRALALSVLSFLYGKSPDELARVNPYDAGLVPPPRDRLERVLFLAVRSDEYSGARTAGELLSLLPGSAAGEAAASGASPAQESRTGASGRPAAAPADGTHELSFELERDGSLVRKSGNLVLKTGRESDSLIIRNPYADRTENQFAGLALDSWLKRPWLIIIALTVLTGGPLFVPLLLFHLHPASRRWVRRLAARYHDSVVTVDSSSLSVSRQLRTIPLRDIRDISVRKKDEGGSISLDFKLLERDGEMFTFTLYHLSEAEADAAADFILERVGERRGN